MSFVGPLVNVTADESIPRHKIPNRLTDVERRLMTYFGREKKLITCIGNIGAGKSSLVKYLAFHTGMNALFELPDNGFEDHLISDRALYPILATAKDSAKRTLGKYYTAINEFIETQAKHPIESPSWITSKLALNRAALDIQHAYLDLRKMQLQALPHIKGSTCVDGYPLADRFAFCEVLHREMDVPYLTKESLDLIDKRIAREFKELPQPDLLVILKSPTASLLENIKERQRVEERGEVNLPEGLVRLVHALDKCYSEFVDTLRRTGWYLGPVLEIDVSKIDFVSNVRHLISVFEGIEHLMVPKDFKIH